MVKRGDPPDIEIIATGGYIEVFSTPSGDLIYTDERSSRAVEMLDDALGPQAVINTLFLKNSSTFALQDLHDICLAVERSPLPRIIVLQGTTTIDATARSLAQRDLRKTVVLTGTTRPNDEALGQAYFNLGSAISAVQTLPNGVYGVMNGRIIPPFSLRKDPETGRFDTASGEHILVADDS